MTSLQDASTCAQNHCIHILTYICELLSLIVTCRTYRLVMKSGFFAVLVPGACLAEAAPLQEYETSDVFWISEVFFLLLIAGSSYVTATIQSGWHGLLGVSLVLITLLVLSFISLFRRRHYRYFLSRLKKLSSKNFCL